MVTLNFITLYVEFGYVLNTDREAVPVVHIFFLGARIV